RGRACLRARVGAAVDAAVVPRFDRGRREHDREPGAALSTCCDARVSVLFLIQGPPEVASSRTRAFAYLPALHAASVPTEIYVWNARGFVARQMRGRVPIAFHAANAFHRLRVGVQVLLASRRQDRKSTRLN